MAKRYHCPQWAHRRAGWVDLPSLASFSEKPANDAAEIFAKSHPGVQTRVIRKPHGWKPEDSQVKIPCGKDYCLFCKEI